MTSRQLRYFIALAQEGNFARAAERCGIQQPPFSQSIARLERDCGTPLFTRTSVGTVMTAAGRALLPEALAAFEAMERGKRLVAAAIQPARAVRLGVVHAALWGGLPALLEISRHIGVPVELTQMRTNEQLEALACGQLELGFVSPPFVAPARLRLVAVANEAVLAAVPTSLFPDQDSSVTLEAIADRLVMFPRSQGPVLHDALLGLFASRGLMPHIVQETPEMMTTLALVSAGIGSSFVPASVARALPANGIRYAGLGSQTSGLQWPLALAYMPLQATSPAGRLLSAWNKAHPSPK